MGIASNVVRQFVIDAYVKGARIGCAENCDFEGSTAVMTKRHQHARDRPNLLANPAQNFLEETEVPRTLEVSDLNRRTLLRTPHEFLEIIGRVCQ